MGFMFWIVFLATTIAVGDLQETDDVDINVWDRQYPSVVVCLLVRNKAHALPYFFGYLEELDYPKDRMKLFVRVDHSMDASAEIVKKWLENVSEYYHSVDFDYQDEPTRYAGEIGPYEWTDERYQRIVDLKQQALTYARRSWADYIFFLDCDVFLTDPKVLQSLISSKRVAVAPLLRSADDDWSSFWTTTDNAGEFTRDDEFDSLYKRERRGVWPVAAVHSAVLLDLRSRTSQELTFDTKIMMPSYDDIFTDLHILSRSLTDVGARCYLLNEKIYGLILAPMQKHLTELEFDVENMRFTALESLYDGPPGLIYSPFVSPSYPKPSKFGFDEIYVVNLRRRPDRLKRMRACFQLLGVDVEIFDAVDGSTLTEDVLSSMNIHQMPEYRDPYHNRSMTLGEIGCFLSHYNIWRRMVEQKLSKVLIFEDDLRFVRYFRYMLTELFADVDAAKLTWDLIYIGRKRLKTNEDGPMVPNVRFLSNVGYSYWTLAYALTNDGAKKLLDAEPLTRLVPVDEYLPIMFDRHPESGWKKHFRVRNLIAFTSEPLFVYPIRYTGEGGYVSDTENATIIEKNFTPDPIAASHLNDPPIEISHFSDEL